MKDWMRAYLIRLGKDASEKDAFLAFRRLSRTYHPDQLSESLRKSGKRLPASSSYSQARDVLAHPVMPEMHLALLEIIATGAWDPHAEPVITTPDPDDHWGGNPSAACGSHPGNESPSSSSDNDDPQLPDSRMV